MYIRMILKFCIWIFHYVEGDSLQPSSKEILSQYHSRQHCLHLSSDQWQKDSFYCPKNHSTYVTLCVLLAKLRSREHMVRCFDMWKWCLASVCVCMCMESNFSNTPFHSSQCLTEVEKKFRDQAAKENSPQNSPRLSTSSQSPLPSSQPQLYPTHSESQTPPLPNHGDAPSNQRDGARSRGSTSSSMAPVTQQDFSANEDWQQQTNSESFFSNQLCEGMQQNFDVPEFHWLPVLVIIHRAYIL